MFGSAKPPTATATIVLLTLLGVEHVGPADRAEPESEPGSLVADPYVFGCRAEDLVRGREAGQRRKDAAGPPLTGEQ